MSNIPKPGAAIPAPKAPVKPAAPAPKPQPAPVMEPEVAEEHVEAHDEVAHEEIADVPEKVQAPKAEKEFAVEAIEKGYYGNIRRNPGDKFMCTPKLFSKLWMKKI